MGFRTSELGILSTFGIIIFSLIICHSCNEGGQSKSPDQIELDTISVTEKFDENNNSEENLSLPLKLENENLGRRSALVANDILYPWVDNLTIRETPSIKGKPIDEVQISNALKFTGEQSDTSETFVLRGVAYDEPWYKVITGKKIEGWVFGGAVKRKEETKGNEIIQESIVDFPHLGRFDLSTWNQESKSTNIAGDAEITTTVYKKGDQVLKIIFTDVGEYGYSRSYILLDSTGYVLKERSLSFLADLELLEIYEIVKDFTTVPMTQHERMQKMKKHFFELNARPELVNGSWTMRKVNVVQNRRTAPNK